MLKMKEMKKCGKTSRNQVILVTRMSCAKMAEPIKIPFWANSWAK